MEPIKITKFTNYRLNFTYKNKHYSINEGGELYEDYLKLTCKEDKDFFVNLGYTSIFWPGKYIKMKKYGQTYKNSDMSGLVELINTYIDKGE